jgi:MFS superfamily sulfate permease-like transporter
MMFIVVCFLAFFAVSTALAFVFTRRRLNSDLRRAGPKPIADALERRNRTLLLILVGMLAVLAFFEALVPGLAYAIQDLQDNVGTGLPAWALFEVGNGSISWMLYLAVAAGVLAGLVAGTKQALNNFPELGGVGYLDVI